MSPGIERHRAAISRAALSKPIQLAIENGLLSPDQSVFDYGCGQGGDIARLRKHGYQVTGWDPHFAPGKPKLQSDVVNLGFVLNVIEAPRERAEVLKEAWSLAKDLLVVAVRSFSDSKPKVGRRHGDGVVTSLGTFQKFYDQAELRNWVSSTLGASPVPLAPGIVALFRDDRRRQTFVAERFRRAIARSSATRAHAMHDAHPELFTQFYEELISRGRAPGVQEWPRLVDLLAATRTVRGAMSVLRHVHGAEHLEAIQVQRAEDLLVFLSLERLGERPRFSQLDESIQLDVRAFFKTYKEACRQADHFLFSAGNRLLIDAACRDSAVGKLMPQALFIHRSALGALEGVLRVVEGCARSLVGVIEEANVIKIHRQKPLISYLSYPDFDRVGHPELNFSVSVDLSELRAKWHDFEGRENRPILHRKEMMVSEDHPLRKRFTRLSNQEERAGLLSRPDIGTSQGWASALSEAGYEVRGHSLRKG